MNESELIQKGFVRQTDGSWSKPSASLGNSVRPMAASQPKPVAARSLESGKPKRERRQGRVELVVTLVTCRKRELDDDGNVAALKPLRDAIADSLGFDDGDKRIRWEYGQIESRGQHGVLVKIEIL